LEAQAGRSSWSCLKTSVARIPRLSFTGCVTSGLSLEGPSHKSKDFAKDDYLANASVSLKQAAGVSTDLTFVSRVPIFATGGKHHNTDD